MAALEMENEDPAQVRAAQILVSLRLRPLRSWPEWVPMQQQPGEAFSSPPVTTVAAAAAKVMQPSVGEASSSAGTVAAARVVPVRRPPEPVVSMVQSGQASFSLTGAVAAGLPARWPTAKRSRARGETSTSKEVPGQGHPAAAKVSGAPPRSSEQERCAETEMPAASAQAQQPVVAAALYYATVAVAGPGPSTSAAPAPANKEEPMKTPSPNSPLDYGSGAPSSADDAAPSGPTRPQAKRKGTCGGGDEGCSSPAKRVPVAQEEEKPKPMPSSVEPSVQSETRASSSGKGAPRPFDLNLCPLDEEDDGCPDTD